MKTILELRPKGSTLWEFHDDMSYRLTVEVLNSPYALVPTRSGRSRRLSVAEVIEGPIREFHRGDIAELITGHTNPILLSGITDRTQDHVFIQIDEPI